MRPCMILFGSALFVAGALAATGATLLYGSIRPTIPYSEGDEVVVRIRSEQSGHVNVVAWINGQPIKFLFDTGATMTALSETEAKRLGIDIDSGTVTSARSAYGYVQVIRSKVEHMRIGEIVAKDVPVIVLPHEQAINLLGMSFLAKLRWDFSDGVLTIRKP